MSASCLASRRLYRVLGAICKSLVSSHDPAIEQTIGQKEIRNSGAHRTAELGQAVTVDQKIDVVHFSAVLARSSRMAC